MPITQNIAKFNKSIGRELELAMDRIRNLIGAKHWPTDGSYKETLLKDLLKRFLPETCSVGTGFLLFRGDGVSTQTDILLLDKASPTLFKQGELFVVTPDAVRFMIEVKTKVDRSNISGVIKKISDDVERARNCGSTCKAGLFIYKNDTSVTDQLVLDILEQEARSNIKRVVDIVCLGNGRLVRYWDSNPDSGAGMVYHAFHSYKIGGHAFGYFVGNVVCGVVDDSRCADELKWFPIEGGKESMRTATRYLSVVPDGCSPCVDPSGRLFND